MPPGLQGPYACPHNSRMHGLSDPLERFAARLAAGAHGVLVSVERTEGSVPREVGAWMGVTSDAVDGTVGGGHLEHVAIARPHFLALHVEMLPDPRAAKFREEGMPIVTWTIRDPAKWEAVKPYCDNLIFEGFPA